MTKPRGTADLESAIRDATNPPPLIGTTAGDPFNQPPTAEQWMALSGALAAGNAPTVRAILAENQLPAALAVSLSLVRPEAARLQAIIDADVPQSQIDAATVERDLLRQTQPQSVEDASRIGKTLAALIVEIAAMESRHGVAVNAHTDLAGLQNVFSELFDGTPGKKACGGILSAKIRNSLVEAGFDPQRLFREPWTKAFRLQADTSTAPRRRLQSVGGPR